MLLWYASTEKEAVLLSLTLITFAAYAAVLVTAFWDLPLDIPPWHQLLLLYAHFIPMFLLELLLCRTAKLKWRILLPAVLLAVPGLWFVASAEWYAMAWVLAGWWCVPDRLGGVGALPAAETSGAHMSAVRPGLERPGRLFSPSICPEWLQIR